MQATQFHRSNAQALYLVEHFYSIQGEGRYMGTPSIFIRLGGCNLRCPGFGHSEMVGNEKITGCDTLHAVYDNYYKASWRSVDLQMLQDVVLSYAVAPDVDVVITGGEPLLFAQNATLIAFVQWCDARGARITFETNATLAPDFLAHPVFSSSVYAMAVKLSNSGERFERRVKPTAIASIAEHAKEAFFKFTIDSCAIDCALDDEIDEICEIAPSSEVFCMPLGSSAKELALHTPAVLEYCKRRSFHFSDRLHIRFWDKTQGV